MKMIPIFIPSILLTYFSFLYDFYMVLYFICAAIATVGLYFLIFTNYLNDPKSGDFIARVIVILGFVPILNVFIYSLFLVAYPVFSYFDKYSEKKDKEYQKNKPAINCPYCNNEIIGEEYNYSGIDTINVCRNEKCNKSYRVERKGPNELGTYFYFISKYRD